MCGNGEGLCCKDGEINKAMKIPQELKELIKTHVVLAPLTSWRVGGPAQFFASPESQEQLKQVFDWAHKNQLPLTVLGGGSNVLISDAGVDGLVLSLRQLSGIEIQEKNSSDDPDRLCLTVGAGTHKSQLLRVFLQHQLSPALFLSGLPGDVGGGVVMNAGVSEARHPREFGELVDWVEVLRWHEGKSQKIKIEKAKLHWSYRHSEGWQPGVIMQVGISWPNQPEAQMAEKVREVNKLRLIKQPLDKPSGGSVFKNPHPHSAGALIDRCGLKGLSVGGAQVSERHANFIVNFNHASAQDIHQLIHQVRDAVKKRFDISLETEIVYMGRWPKD